MENSPEKKRLFNQLSAPFDSDATQVASAPWTVEDMNAYYLLRRALDKPVDKELHQRRGHIIYQNPLTNYDDLQFTRETAETAALRKELRYELYLDELEILSYLEAGPSPEDQPKYCCFEWLFQLLDLYRVQLQKGGADKKIALGIDAIAVYFAQHFENTILNHTIEAQRPAIKAMLTRLGALNQEIFPWLSVFFKEALLNLDERETEEALESFIQFHALLGTAEWATLMGGSIKPLIKEYLKIERNRRDAILKSDAVISNITYYLQEKPQNWLLFEIFMWVQKQAPSADIHFLAYIIVALSYTYPKLLAKTHDYIVGEKNFYGRRLSPQINDKHGYLIGILEQDPKTREEAINLALRVDFLPPAIPLLYAMWQKNPKKTQAIIADYANRHSGLLRTTMIRIFSNETDQKQQYEILAANLHESISAVYYPFFALKQIVETESKPNDTQLIKLWIGLIDSGLLSTPYFLAAKSHQKIFETLENISNFRQKATLSFAQTKVLCVALALYRATQLDKRVTSFMEDLYGRWGNIYRWIEPPTISYLPRSEWAELLCYQLLYNIAYPDPEQINFANIVRFLDISFPFPAAQLTAQKTQNYSHQQKLLHMFLQLFFAKQQTANITQKNYQNTIQRELPVVYQQIIFLAMIRECVITPPWFSIAMQESIGCIMNGDIQKAYIILAYSSHFDDDEQLESTAAMYPAQTLLNDLINLRKKIQISGYFINKLYLSYCETHQDLDNTDCPLQQFIQIERRRETLENESQAIDALIASIQKKLKDHHDICLSYLGWWTWWTWFLGYDIAQSDKQMEHFREIRSVIKNQDISSLSGCQELIEKLEETIRQKTFKRYFWLSSVYHNDLITLHQHACQIKKKLLAEPLVSRDLPSASNNRPENDRPEPPSPSRPKERKRSYSVVSHNPPSLFQPIRKRQQSLSILTLDARPGWQLKIT